MDELQFHKRDTSWLAFNHRVLQEAMDDRVPLYERIKFLAIYSSNLDEFYRVRVSALRRFKQMDKVERKQLIDLKPKRELNDIKRIVHHQQTEFGKIFRQEILPQLREHGIHLINTTSQVSAQHRKFLKTYFIDQVLPKLDRQYIKEGQDAPFLQNRNLYLVATFSDSEQLGLVNIPSDVLRESVMMRINLLILPPNKGIDRHGGNCVYRSDWRMYRCKNMKYKMFVFESLDADTETRYNFNFCFCRSMS